MSEGKLPNFARLRQEGAYGRLQSMQPAAEPRHLDDDRHRQDARPARHRPLHRPSTTDGRDQLPVTSHMRQVKALWNILSDAGQEGRRGRLVGDLARRRHVNGAIVSDHTCYHFLFPQGQDPGAADAAALTYPPELFDAHRAADPPPARHHARGSHAPSSTSPPRSSRGRSPSRTTSATSSGRWPRRTATAASASSCGRSERPDLLLAYIEGTDSVAHLFGHLFRAQGLSGELLQQQQKYGDAVEQMYQSTPTASWATTWRRWTATRRSSCCPTTASSWARCRTIRARRATCGG